MKSLQSKMFFSLLTLAVLLLAACQPAVLETTSPTQADTQATAPLPAETAAVVENTAPASSTENVSPMLPSAEQTPPSAQVPENWQTLDDTSQGYSLAYPPEWVVCEEHRFSRIFCGAQEEPTGPGPALRLYVSAVPQDYTNEDFEVYNFIPMEKVREFMALPVGEAALLHPGSLPEYFTYTRLHNRMVAGWAATVIENSKVWEFPEGTKQRVVFIVTEGTTYTIGMYYQTPEQLAQFEQVLDSFELAP